MNERENKSAMTTFTYIYFHQIFGDIFGEYYIPLTRTDK